MIYKKYIPIPKILLSILFIASQVVSAQKLSTELHSKLSISDQKKLQKADETYAKGKKIEDEINPATKDEKKSQLKWLEAASYYQEANSARNKVYTANIKDFWKKYKGEKNPLDFSKKIEEAANDSFKTAQQIRNAADKERKMPERIRLLVRAEKLESKSLVMMQKALFTYISWPIEFDRSWISSEGQDVPQTAKTTETKNKKAVDDTTQTKDKPLLVSQPVSKTTVTKDTAHQTKTVPVLKTPKKQTEGIAGNDSSLYGKINVSEDQVDKFNNFLEKKYPSKYEDYVINFQNLDYSDINALKEAWYKYQFGTAADTTTTMLAATQDTLVKEQNLAADTIIKTKTLADKTGKDIKTVSKGTHKQTDVALNTKNNTGTKGKPDKTSNTHQPISDTKPDVSNEKEEVATGFTFRVQIAACRVPLDEKTLKGIYNGLLKVSELNEENWYKYAIGKFNTYKAARQLRDQSGIPGAFVIAYLNGKRIKITPGIAYKRYTNVKPENLVPALISYRIQIAASKIVLSESHIKNIYNGPLKVEVLKEGGWNKYYLVAGKTFAEAKNLLKQISIPGAFILAYYQNTRIEISAATRFTQ
jgi:hypothetical protein